MKRIFFAGFLLLGLTLLSRAQTSPAAYTDPEAYAVYSAMLFDDSTAHNAKSPRLVIQLETRDYPRFGKTEMDCLVPAPDDEAIYSPVIAVYKEVNKMPWLLQTQFTTKEPYVLISGDETKSIFAKGPSAGWKEFYRKYPKSDGIAELSAVAFNSDKTVAIVYAGTSCGPLCGSGSYNFLRKKDGKWVPAAWHGTICTWNS